MFHPTNKLTRTRKTPVRSLPALKLTPFCRHLHGEITHLRQTDEVAISSGIQEHLHAWSMPSIKCFTKSMKNKTPHVQAAVGPRVFRAKRPSGVWRVCKCAFFIKEQTAFTRPSTTRMCLSFPSICSNDAPRTHRRQQALESPTGHCRCPSKTAKVHSRFHLQPKHSRTFKHLLHL